MAENQRIDDLRRRVQKDPASIAFAQLGEELRRAGQCQEALDICRAGLTIHPGYLSARVTLGRALLELNQLGEAQNELEIVLKSAPENLAAIRGLAEIHHRSGNLKEALRQYRVAFSLAPNDPELEHTVQELAREVEPPKSAATEEGLSFDDMQRELMKIAPPPVRPASPIQAAPLPVEPPSATQAAPPSITPSQTVRAAVPPAPSVAPASDGAQAGALATVAALEQFLTAIHVTRADRRA